MVKPLLQDALADENAKAHFVLLPERAWIITLKPEVFIQTIITFLDPLPVTTTPSHPGQSFHWQSLSLNKHLDMSIARG
jgi:hypothetical protein